VPRRVPWDATWHLLCFKLQKDLRVLLAVPALQGVREVIRTCEAMLRSLLFSTRVSSFSPLQNAVDGLVLQGGKRATHEQGVQEPW